jgi:ABC-type antimicrobial peptide transport system permease subunit
MDELMGGVLGPDRFAAFLMTVFAGAALLLATIGVYGVVAFNVSERRREMGLRLALGASSSDIFRLVLESGARLALLGVGLGLAGAFVLSRYVASVLFQTSPSDPGILALAALLLVATVLVASYVPARRAARVDPTQTLRYD